MPGDGILSDWPTRGAHVSDECPNCDHRTSLLLRHENVAWPKVQIGNGKRGRTSGDRRALLAMHVLSQDHGRMGVLGTKCRGV